MKKLTATGDDASKVGIEKFKSTLSRELHRAFGQPDIMINMYGFDIDGLETILLSGYLKGALIAFRFRDCFPVDIPDSLSEYRISNLAKKMEEFDICEDYVLEDYDLYIDELDNIELFVEQIVEFLHICQLENHHFTVGREYYDKKSNAYRLISFQFHKEYKSPYCAFLNLQTGEECEGWWKGPGYPIENDNSSPVSQLYYRTDGCFSGSCINVEKKYLKRIIYGVAEVDHYKQKLKKEMLKAFGEEGLVISMCSWRTEKPLIIGVVGTDYGVKVSCRFSYGKIMDDHNMNNNWIKVENNEQIDEVVDKIIININELLEIESYNVLGGVYADRYSSNIYRVTAWRFENDHKVRFTLVNENTGEEREGWGEDTSETIVDDSGLVIMPDTYRIDN